MKKIILLSLFCVLIVQLIAQVVVIPKSDIIETQNNKSYYVHTVQKGQTAYSIAKAYNVTVDELYFENPTAKNGLSINQKLYIPTINKESELKNDVVATNYDFFYHVASNNETFDNISKIYLIPKKYIIIANPNLTSPLREGEYVKVPVKEAFAILDGNPSASSNNNNTYQKPHRNTKPNHGNTKSANAKKQTTTKPVNKKPISTSETVSFDPNIPVIQDYRHVVILGETTKSIAEKYGLPIKLLKAVNPNLGNSVKKGDRLRIPDKTKLVLDAKEKETKKPQVEAPKVISPKTADTVNQSSSIKKESDITKHLVKKKETLYSIGREYGVTVDEIFKVNKGLTTTIKPGQVILIPKKKINKPYIIYVPNKNTKTTKIAKLYRIPVYQIRDYNPVIGKRVSKNQEVRIPVGSHAIFEPLAPGAVDEHAVIEDITEVVDEPLEECNFSPNTNVTYKIALMVPLYVEETDSLDRSQFLNSSHKQFLPFRFIQFYEGALLAVDSLKNQGMNVDLYVYDVDKNLTKTARVLQNSELRSMDLIIGPFYNNSFNQVALFAGTFNIPIVNPLSYREEVTYNYNSVIKVKPDISFQAPMIEPFINNFAPNSKVFLISQTSYTDADKVIDVQNTAISTIPQQIKMSNQDLFDLSFQVAQRDTLFDITTTPPPFIYEGTTIYPEIIETALTDSTLISNNLIRINYSSDSLHPFLDNASPLRNNLVLLYGTKKSFILDVLNRLNESRDTFDIQLVGMPTWERISNLSNQKMNNLNLSYFSSRHINYDTTTQKFIQKFRNNYFIEPNEYAFSGYDMTYYFLDMLFNLGDDFTKCIENYPKKMLQSNFSFSRVGDSNNFVNDSWYMLQIRNMTQYKIPSGVLIPYTKSTNNE